MGFSKEYLAIRDTFSKDGATCERCEVLAEANWYDSDFYKLVDALEIELSGMSKAERKRSSLYILKTADRDEESTAHFDGDIYGAYLKDGKPVLDGFIREAWTEREAETAIKVYEALNLDHTRYYDDCASGFLTCNEWDGRSFVWLWDGWHDYALYVDNSEEVPDEVKEAFAPEV